MVRSAVADGGALAPASPEQGVSPRMPGTRLAAAASSSTPLLASTAVVRARPGPGERAAPIAGYALRLTGTAAPPPAPSRRELMRGVGLGSSRPAELAASRERGACAPGPPPTMASSRGRTGPSPGTLRDRE